MRALVPILLVGLLPVPSPPRLLDEARPATVIPAAPAPGTIDELRRDIGAVLEREGVPGVGLALVGRDGPLWVGGVGVADRRTRAPVTADTVFRVASITKSIVGLGVMRLVEQGRLTLDRPLRELLPDVAIDNPWEASAPVTLAQVLEHTAGLDDMRPNETFVADDEMSTTDALAINPRSRVIRWRPGSRPAYSNVGYALAGRAIEVATGEPFDRWLRREILLPLGMPEADFHRSPGLAARLATGYDEPDHAARFVPIAHRPAGALLASATDLAHLVQFWLRRGDGTSIVSRAGLDRIERTGTLPFPRTDVDYGLGNYGDVAHPVRGRGHDGGLPGFSSSMRYFPELGVGYVMLLNGTFSLRAYLEIRQLLFAYLARGRSATEFDPGAAVAEPGAAFFAYANPRHALTGFFERAVLGWGAEAQPKSVRLDPLVGAPFELEATSDGGFRFPGESGTSMRFARGRDGKPVMISGFAYAEAAPELPARAFVAALAIAEYLLRLAPLWAVVVIVLAAIRRRRLVARGLLLWPAIAGLCVTTLLPYAFFRAARDQVLGLVHFWTLAVFAITVLIGFAGAAAGLTALHWSLRPDRPSWVGRLVPTLCALAAVGMALWLGANGWIGLRTWAW